MRDSTLRIEQYVTDDYVFELLDDRTVSAYQIGSRKYLDTFGCDDQQDFYYNCYVWIYNYELATTK